MSSGSSKPNFFLIGAPKCGTTALCAYLGSHPDIHFANPKEPLFFHTDFADAHRRAHNWEEYLRCFDGREMERCSMVGEGSVWYLYSREAVANILEFNPSSKFLVMIRNPVSLAHSLHAQLLYGGAEDVEDFERAWRLQTARARGECIPRACADPKALQYGAIAKVGEQLQRLYTRVPRDRVKVIRLDELRSDARLVYRETLGFLGVAPHDCREFPVLNANRRVRLKRIARLLYLGVVAKRKLGIRRSLGVWQTVSPIVTEEAPRPPLPDALREELQAYFSDDIQRLCSLLGSDTSASWS